MLIIIMLGFCAWLVIDTIVFQKAMKRVEKSNQMLIQKWDELMQMELTREIAEKDEEGQT